ncbi:MAG TPA: hypothetical protein VL201_00495 [Patescibacteria group bacterium]|nr:hypothetical protein [Patescibacteria group bacterium]
MNIIQPLGAYTRYNREYGTNIVPSYHFTIHLSRHQTTTIVRN